MGQVNCILQMMWRLLPDHRLHKLLFCFILSFLEKNSNGREAFFLGNLDGNLILSCWFIVDTRIGCFEYFKLFEKVDLVMMFEGLADKNFFHSRNYLEIEALHLLYLSWFDYIVLPEKNFKYFVNLNFHYSQNYSNYLFILWVRLNSEE